MIIYLHGFGSTGTSSKVDSLKKRFGDNNVFAPDLPIDPIDVCSLIQKHVNQWYNTRSDDDTLVFVGISLGAFYASYFANVYSTPSVIINPSVQPSERLTAKLGKNENYVTKEEFWVTLGHLETLSRMREYLLENSRGYLIHLFAAKDDEVIPYQEMLEWYKYTASTTVEETGGHRFLDHWDKVVDKVAELV